jgi:septation ring formation regulator EzrA
MIEKYKERYMELCSLLDEYSKTGVKKHNKAMKELAKLFSEVSNNQEIAEKLYSELMDSDDERVKSIAAAHSLGMNINLTKAQKTLKEISQKSNEPLSRFNAEMTLKTWKEQGYLKF